MLLLILFVLAIAAWFAAVLYVLRTGIRIEDQAGDLTDEAPTLVTALTRRLLGLHVRRPAHPVPGRQCDGRDHGHGDLAGCTGNPDEGEAR